MQTLLVLFIFPRVKVQECSVSFMLLQIVLAMEVICHIGQFVVHITLVVMVKFHEICRRDAT